MLWGIPQQREDDAVLVGALIEILVGSVLSDLFGSGQPRDVEHGLGELGSAVIKLQLAVGSGAPRGQA